MAYEIPVGLKLRSRPLNGSKDLSVIYSNTQASRLDSNKSRILRITSCMLLRLCAGQNSRNLVRRGLRMGVWIARWVTGMEGAHLLCHEGDGTIGVDAACTPTPQLSILPAWKEDNGGGPPRPWSRALASVIEKCRLTPRTSMSKRSP